MNLKVIVPLSMSPNRREVCHHLLRRYNVDLAMLMACTLDLWFELSEQSPEEVLTALHLPMDKLLHARARRLSFEEHLVELVNFREALYRIHSAMDGILAPILQGLYQRERIRLSLKCFLAGGLPVVEIRHHEN